jgi:hypothetical protein
MIVEGKQGQRKCPVSIGSSSLLLYFLQPKRCALKVRMLRAHRGTASLAWIKLDIVKRDSSTRSKGWLDHWQYASDNVHGGTSSTQTLPALLRLMELLL